MSRTAARSPPATSSSVYLPAAVLTGRVASVGVPEWLAYASPAAGPLLYVLARYAWYRALRHYESVGG
jgi:ABC-2 type transport system permease protein